MSKKEGLLKKIRDHAIWHVTGAPILDWLRAHLSRRLGGIVISLVLVVWAYFLRFWGLGFSARVFVVLVASAAIIFVIEKMVQVYRWCRASNAESSPQTKPNLKLEDVWLEPGAAGLHLEYPLKLRIVLTNNSGKEITVNPPTWISEDGDIAVRPQRYALQAETHVGWRAKKDTSWGAETTGPIIVGDSRAIRTWIGLHESPGLNDDEVRRRIAIKKLGILAFKITVDNKVVTEKIRL